MGRHRSLKSPGNFIVKSCLYLLLILFCGYCQLFRRVIGQTGVLRTLVCHRVYSASQTVKERARESEKNCHWSKLFINTGLGGIALSSFLKTARNYYLSNMIKRAKHFQWERSIFLTWDIYSFFLRIFLRKWSVYWMDGSPETINYYRKKYMKEVSTGEIRKLPFSLNSYFSSNKLHHQQEENSLLIIY